MLFGLQGTDEGRMRKKFHLPKVQKCHKTGKTIYKTQEQARTGMMRVISHDPHADMFDLHTYPCDDHFHFGHQKFYRPDTVSTGATA